MPRGTKAIARVSGVSIDQVKTYLYRRRKTARKYMRELAWMLRNMPSELVDIGGNKCSARNAQELRFNFDHWSLTTVLYFKDFEGVEHWVNIEDLPRLYKETTDLFSQEP